MFDSKAISLSKLVASERLLSNPPRHSAAFKGSPQFCSCTGISHKKSCLTTSNKAISPIGKEEFAVETLPYEINGTNGASSSLFLTEMRELEAFDDEYGGVIVNSERLPINPKVIASRLQSSLSHWKIQGKKEVWLKLPLERSELVPIAVKEGFQYHHAERGYVMLTYWIPKGPCMLPAKASHQVGVGRFVINDKNEVLVVHEKHYAPALAGLWKIPTGFICESEEIFTGAVREVKLILNLWKSYLSSTNKLFLHYEYEMLNPGWNFQYAIPMLWILNKGSMWMPLVEFVEQPLMQKDSMFKRVIDICVARLGKRYCGLCAHQLVSKFDSRLSSLYYNVVQY